MSSLLRLCSGWFGDFVSIISDDVFRFHSACPGVEREGDPKVSSLVPRLSQCIYKLIEEVD